MVLVLDTTMEVAAVSLDTTDTVSSLRPGWTRHLFVVVQRQQRNRRVEIQGEVSKYKLDFHRPPLGLQIQLSKKIKKNKLKQKD